MACEPRLQRNHDLLPNPERGVSPRCVPRKSCDVPCVHYEMAGTFKALDVNRPNAGQEGTLLEQFHLFLREEEPTDKPCHWLFALRIVTHRGELDQGVLKRAFQLGPDF